MNLDFKPITETAYMVGEGPVWDDRTNTLLFADILEGVIHSIGPDGSSPKSWKLPGAVGSFGLAESGRLVVAVNSTVGLFDRVTSKFEKIVDIDADVPEMRLNDGKVGPDGAFWTGTIHEPPEFHLPPPPPGQTRLMPARKPIGVMVRVAPDGSVTRLANGYHASNGYAFSPDGRTVYHSDSALGIVYRWTLDPATGVASDRKVLITLKEEDGRPDGAATDIEGYYWSAGISAACLNRISPDGRIADKVPMPVASPTMPCFGGPGLRTLFVTSLRHSRTAEALAKYPMTGRVLAAPSPVAGSPVTRFRDV